MKLADVYQICKVFVKSTYLAIGFEVFDIGLSKSVRLL